MFTSKNNTCQNYPDKSYTEKKAEHIPPGYFLVTCCSFDKSKSERKYYRGKDCMIMCCEDLKEQAMKIINYDKEKIIPLTDKEKETHENQKVCYICKKGFGTNKKFCKVRDHCDYTEQYRGAAHSICNLRYQIPKEIPVVFHNRSTYDYHFIIKQLAREFKYYLECLGENTEKYMTFSVTIKKVLDNDNDNDNDNDKKNGKGKKAKTITYRPRFIDSCRFMQDSLSNLIDNLPGINNKESIDKVSKINKK